MKRFVLLASLSLVARHHHHLKVSQIKNRPGTHGLSPGGLTACILGMAAGVLAMKFV